MSPSFSSHHIDRNVRVIGTKDAASSCVSVSWLSAGAVIGIVEHQRESSFGGSADQKVER